MVVMPVYNEIGNIAPLISSFSKVREKIPSFDVQICFVDDSSPDGTGDAIRSHMDDNKWINLLRRDEKNGLGEAYLAGFSHVFENFDPDYIGQMDSDLSHDPFSIIEMTEHLKTGSDVVIGSRYIRGGRIEGWPLSRKIISRGGNAFARIVGGISGVKDCTSGFRIIKTENLRACLERDSIPVSGYSFLIHLLSSLIKTGSGVSETPIIFRERVHGESKLGNGDIREFISSVSKLRFRGG